MWQTIYLRRLRQDLEKWVERGWVTPAHAQSILTDASGGAAVRHIPQILAIMGAVLVGFAVMSFVAANWAEIPKIIRLLMIFSALWVAWGAAWFADRRGHPAYAEAGVVAGLALFGANIMLIGQIYHVTSSTPEWVMLWCLIALAAAWSLPSRAALAITYLLAVLWAAWALDHHEQISWAFFLPWLGATWLTIRMSWRAGLHLALLTLWVWAGVNAGALQELIGCNTGSLVALFALVALMQWVLGLRLSSTSIRFGSLLENYGMLIAFAAMATFQLEDGYGGTGILWYALALVALSAVGALAFSEVAAQRLSMRNYGGLAALGIGALVYPLVAQHDGYNLLFYAALFLTLSVWLVAYGTARNHRFAINAGLVAFAGECLYLYFQTLGTLLNTAAFFAIGGILLIAGSLILPKLRRRLVASTEEGDAK
ncbi:MAG: DUF2157 domain-containing protein [Parvibaculum sp.]|nr:DUF2157 domain-containing protein [Parvibaculum sp.]